MSRSAATQAPAARENEPRRAPRRRRRPRVWLVGLVGVALVGGVSSGVAAARRAHLDSLRRQVVICQQAGRALAAPWYRLAPDDRVAVGRTLLGLRDIAWDADLHQAWLVELLLGRLRDDADPALRAAAARALGELGLRTERSVGHPPPALRQVLNGLGAAAEGDPESRVRSAAAAALVRLWPVTAAAQAPLP